MSPQAFKAWRGRMAKLKGKYSQADAARDLDISLPMVKLYEKGTNSARRDATGQPTPVLIPKSVALACAALETGLEPL